MVMLPTSHGPISTAICYEIVFPALVRESVLKGSELLTTITNDAWYGHSSAPYQHFLQASMRAIEQGRYLARAANTGISGIVDPYGRVVQQSAIFERTVMVGDVRMLQAPHDLWQNRRSVRPTSVRRSRWPRCFFQEAFVAIALDDLTRRYQDLVKRAADLRSYL